MSTRDAYVEKYKAQLDLIDAEIDRFEAKARVAKAEGKIRIARELSALRSKRDAARTRLAEIRAASGDAWETLKQGAEEAWSVLSDAARDAVQRLKE